MVISFVKAAVRRLCGRVRPSNSEIRLHAIMANVADGIVTIDEDCRIENFNPAAERMFGYRAAEVVGRNVKLLMPEPHRAAHDGYVRTYIRTGVSKVLGIGPRELTGLRKDGSTFPIDLAIAEMRLGGRRLFIGTIRDISRRKAAEAALAEQEITLRTLIESIPDEVFIKDTDERFQLVNASAAKLFGYTVEEIVGRTDAELFPDRDVEFIHISDRRVLDLGESQTYETPWQVGEETCWIMVVKGPLRAPDGRIRGIVGVGRDVTGHKRAEVALRESEARLRGIIDGIPDMVFVKDLDDRYTLINPTTVETWGVDEQDFIGRTSLENFPADKAELFRRTDRQVLESGRPITFEWQIERDNEVRHFRSTKSLYRDSEGRPLGFVGTAQDVTERRRTEEELRDSETTLRAIIDGISDMVVVKDLNGRPTLINASAAEFRGEDGAAVLGRTSDEVHPPELGDLFRRTDRQVVETGDPVTFEWQTRREGREALFVTTKSLFRDAEGRPSGIVGIARDVTEQRRMEEELRQAQRMEAVGQLTGGMAHDFNNLLAVILGSLELIEDRIDPGDAERGHIERAMEAARRGATLTEHLLAFSRKQALQPQPTDLNDLVDGMYELLRQGVEEDIDIRRHLADDLWPAEVDRGQLENALLNLVLNARDAISADGGVITIETANRRAEVRSAGSATNGAAAPEYVMLAVRDDGPGMPPEVAERAFDPFFTTKGPGRGSGLGLSMVHGFVEQSGGHVEIDSRPGSGTAVRIFLPRADVTADAVPALPAHLAAGRPRGNGEAVLVVEDDDMVRELTARSLEELGYQPLAAADGPAAIKLLEARADVAVLFTDVVLAGPVGGAELVRRAARLRPGLKVLFTSGYTRAEMTEHGKLDPGVRLIRKPYRRDRLARALYAVLRDLRDNGGR